MQKESSGTLYKTLIREDEISLCVIDSTAVVNEAIARHHLTPVAAAALGRTLTATAYLCSWLKEEESTISVVIDGGGPGGKLRTAGDGALRLRGSVEEPHVMLPPRPDGKLDVGGCVGRTGTITVVRDDGEGIPFVGTSALVSGEIAEDFSAYFLTSEQRPTAIALGVLIAHDGHCAGAGGVFLQPLPFARESSIAYAEREIARFGSISSMISKQGAAEILRMFGVEEAERRPVVFSCRCSRERAERALLSLGRADAMALADEQGQIVVHCPDCNTDYTFSRRDVACAFERSR